MVPQWPRKNLIGSDFSACVAKLVPEREREKPGLHCSRTIGTICSLCPQPRPPLTPSFLGQRVEKSHIQSVMPGPADTTRLPDLQAGVWSNISTTYIFLPFFPKSMLQRSAGRGEEDKSDKLSKCYSIPSTPGPVPSGLKVFVRIGKGLWTVWIHLNKEDLWHFLTTKLATRVLPPRQKHVERIMQKKKYFFLTIVHGSVKYIVKL